MTPAAEVTGLTLRSGLSVVFDHLELTAPGGQVIAVVGRAFAGKSALLGALLGRVVCASGEVRVGGLNVQEHALTIRRQTTWVARCGVLESHLTVRQNLGLVLRLSGRVPPDRTEIERALRQSDVPDRTFDARASTLTPRETFSVWLASARLRKTPLVLLDDPAALLSPSESTRAAVLIRELSADGATILVTTRDHHFARQAGDAVYILEGGRLTAAPPVEAS